MNPQTTELIERHRDINTDHDWWDGVYDCFTADMDTIGVTVVEIAESQGHIVKKARAVIRKAEGK